MSNEWYTPASYIESARLVMGSIALDPASCAFANRVVKARQFYTREENGLLYPWKAESVFLNPPYGRTEKGGGSYLERFTEHLLEQYLCGNTKQAILLIPVNTATRWFAPLWDYPICFPSARIRFYNEQGTGEGVSFGTCVVYLGPNIQGFTQIFRSFGTIATRVSSAPIHLHELALWKGEVQA